MNEKRFPIIGGLSVLWTAAELAYVTYKSKGSSQPLERIAERGGFGILEFVMLFLPCDDPTEERISRALMEADIRSNAF